MINVTALTEYISGNRGYIEDILVALGYRSDELRFNSKGFYQFRRLEGDNPKAIQLWIESLNYVCYTRPEKGNLYTLVMKENRLTFPAALRWISDVVSFWPEESSMPDVKLPFGGYYHGLVKTQEYPELSQRTYDESVIAPYQNAVSYMWNADGISYKTQEAFGIGMDLESNSILIPERNIAGELIGIQARRNDSNCPHAERWWAFLPCSRHQTLFGYSMNYEEIVKRDSVFIVESEKSVMKGFEMGIRNVVAICGAVISDTQVRLLKGLRVKTYMLALDDGLPDEHYEKEARKLLVNTTVMRNRVLYIKDTENKYLVSGGKESPFDKPLEILKALTKECSREVKYGQKLSSC